MPLTNILEVELSDLWRIDFMGPFCSFFNNHYILVAVNYVPKWVKAIATQTNDSWVVMRFVKKNIFSRFGVLRAVISDGCSQFCDSSFEALLKKYGVTHKVVLAYPHQTKGQMELANRELKQILEKTVSNSRRIGQISQMKQFGHIGQISRHLQLCLLIDLSLESLITYQLNLNIGPIGQLRS